MNLLASAARFLSIPPGDLVYHLVVLFAIEAMMAMTLRYGRVGRARRWVLATLGLGAGRLILILVAVLSALRIIPSPVAVTPPLERFIEIASLGLLAWAFVPLLEGYPRVGNILGVSTLVLSAVVYAWAAPQWFVASSKGVYFNGSPQDILGGLWALALCVFAALASLVRRRGGWSASFVAFSFLAAGHALHLVFPLTQLAVAEWARLGALIAYPLFAMLVLNEILEARVASPALARPRAPQPAQPTTLDLWPVAEACRSVTGANDLALALQNAASTISKTLKTDLAAIGVPGGSPDTVELVAIHHSGATPELGVTFPLASQPTMQRAISRKHPATLGPEQGEETMALCVLLGGQMPRPMLLMPLIYDHEALGVLILGREPMGSSEQEHAARVVAEQLASALGVARKTETHARRADELASSLRDHELRATQARLMLEEQLAQHKADLQQAMEQLHQAQDQAMHHQKRAEELAALIELQMQEDRAAHEQGTPADWQEQARRLTAEQQQAMSEAREWKEEAERLVALQATLENELQNAKRQIASLRELEAQGRGSAMVGGDMLSYGVLVSDARGQVVAASNTAARLLGRSRKALVGQPLAQVCLDPRWSENVQALVMAPDGAQPVQSPVQFIAEFAGRSLDVELATLAGKDDSTSGGTVAVLTVPGDQNPESGSRNEIIASLAQELRTPMTSINGYTDLLLNESAGILGAMQRQFLQRVRANIERMSGMLDDLIRVTAIDIEQVELEPEPVDLIEIIEEAIMGSSAQYRERNIAIQLDLAERLPPLHADRDSLYQIMSHLLANASQCSKPGSEVIVHAHSQPEAESYLVVSVTDTGGGIHPADRQRVFSRRYRADNPLIEGLGDTGIGLSIVKTLVEAHGGRVWVDSEMGLGSTFSLLVPVSQATGESQVEPGIPNI